MVEFNRWLVEVLADTHTEGIEWGPSYGERPWLALENQQQPESYQLDEAFTLRGADTAQLLRASREHDMMRRDSLQRTNADLTEKLEQAKAQLKETLIRAFQSEQILRREKELTALREQHLVLGMQFGDYLAQQKSTRGYPNDLCPQIDRAFRMLNGLRSVPTAGSNSAPVKGLEDDTSEVEEVDVEPDLDHNEPEGPNQENIVAKPSIVYYDELPVQQKTIEHSEAHCVSELKPSSSANSNSCEYEQLVQLNTNDEKSGSWYRQALRKLKEQREQRRLLLKSGNETAKKRAVARRTPYKVEMEAGTPEHFKPLEFHDLVTTRDSTDDGAGSAWYHKTLQLLKDERMHRASLRSRAGSFSSTISIVD
ncbi:unnamed protein product [Phytophthora fragariaefolia]|uniref:Unnamed protein product n=1 Tax=Phytophthora fragariaefolia TaxID=1490495 RepID=A0A9W6U2L9_9STRA|nr:unnamed protein product [Phytophthora fragariaefolia]